MKTYTLKKHPYVHELHLFEGRLTSEDGKSHCSSEAHSICGQMIASDDSENVFAHANADLARKQCAEVGKQVCAACITHLYTTYPVSKSKA